MVKGHYRACSKNTLQSNRILLLSLYQIDGEKADPSSRAKANRALDAVSYECDS